MFNPIITISRIFVTFVVRRVNLPLLFAPLGHQVFLLARRLIRSEGFIPVITVLYQINREVMRGGNVRNIINCTRYPMIEKVLIDTIKDSWLDLISFKTTINKLFIMFILGIIFVSSPRLCFILLRTILGFLLTSLGVVYSESLSSIYYLKDFSQTFINFIEEHSPFKFLSSDNILTSPEKIIIDNDTNNNNTLAASYSILGIILLGLLGIFIGVFVEGEGGP